MKSNINEIVEELSDLIMLALSEEDEILGKYIYRRLKEMDRLVDKIKGVLSEK